MLYKILVIIAAFGLGTIAFAQINKAGITPPTKKVVQEIFYPEKKQVDFLNVSWVGDMVPSDFNYNQNVFDNVKSELQKSDLLIGNLEGTFAEEWRLSKCEYAFLNNCHAFRGDKNFADALLDAGFKVVSLKNNHSLDYGEAGLEDTIRELDRVGIKYVSIKNPTTSIKIKDKNIGILGLSSTKPWETISDYNFIKKNIEKLKTENDFVIVLFHGGNEGSDKTSVPYEIEYTGTENRGDVAKVAYTAIDSGADLVLGAGPHVLRKVEVYKNKTIAYSLGNFVGGNGRLITSGMLGISGIFNTTLSEETLPINSLTSVILNRSGKPFIDEQEKGKELLNELSKKQ